MQMTEGSPAPAIRSLVSRYLDCFNAADFDGALGCYRLPFSWFFGPKVATVATCEKFLAMMTRTRDGLVDQGLGHSALMDCTVRMLGPGAALAGVAVSRRFADGTEMELTGGTYHVHNDGEGWRLTSFVSHPLDEIVPGIKG